MATKRVVYQYKDKTSGRIISNDDIIADDDNGILEHLGGMAFRFVPKANLDKIPIAADYGYDETDMPTLPTKSDVTHFDGAVSSGGTNDHYLGDYYDYTFGINAIDIKETKPKDSCGFISKEINVGNCDYIELYAETSGGNVNVEYSIIDGVNEVPILPVNQTYVMKEKMFPQLDLRFEPDTRESNLTIYRNNIVTGNTLETMKDTIYFGDDIYTASYTPKPKYHQYHPSNTSIKVKVVERKIFPDDIPATINTITIERHGGERIWTM